MTEAQAPGFFGKIPSRGDFLSRRVPPGVAAAWDSWLQTLTSAVRTAGARGWQDAWLTAPLWHFVLGAQVAPPHGAAGVLVASADRVGRLFPFTLIGAASPDSAWDLPSWAQHAEALALAALQDEFDPATLDSGLLQLGPPPAPYGQNRPIGIWPIVFDGDWPAAADALAEDEAAQPGVGPDQSEWWCRGSDRIAAVRIRCMGLPGPRLAPAMILGGEDLHMQGA